MRVRFGPEVRGAMLRGWTAAVVPALLGVLGGASVAPRDAAAFWPLTRSFRAAEPDSAAKARNEALWAKFQIPPGRMTASERDSAAAVAAAAGAASGPQTFISRANSNEQVGGTAPATPAAVAADSTVTTAPDSVTAPPSMADLIRRAQAQAAADSAAAAGGGVDSDSVSTGYGSGTGTPGGLPGNTSTGTPATNAAAMALAARMAEMAGWAPVLTSKMTLNSDNQDTAVDMRSSFTDASGVSLTNSLGYRNLLSLLRKQETDTRMLSNTLAVPLRNKGFTFGMTTTNTKTTQASQATTGNALTTASNSKAAQAYLQVSKALLDLPGLSQTDVLLDGIGVNASAALDYGASRNDQNTSNGIGSSSNKHQGAGRSYGAGVTFSRLQWMNVRARTGRLRRNNDDTIEQIRQLNSAPERSESETKSAGDTTSVDITVPVLWKVKTLTVGFRTANGVDTRPENATGIGGIAQGTGFQFETTRSYSRAFNLSAKVLPFSRLDTGVTVSVGRDSTGFRIKRLSFTDTDRYNWKVENHLQIWGTGLLTANYESSRAKVNRDVFNPLTGSVERSPQTRRDTSNKLYADFLKDLTATWKTKLSYEIQLDQGFYEHPGSSGGVSDVDQLRTRLALDFSGQMTPNALAQVSIYYRSLDKVYIDPTQSALSKNESEYVVRPSYSWTISPKVTVSQRFSLESKVLDDIFQPERSTLDRNHTMNTGMKYDLTSRLHLDAQYDYGLQDNGSYVQAPGFEGRFYTPGQRTKKDQISLNTRCDLLRDGKLAFVSQQVSTRTRRLNAVSGAGSGRQITESDALTLGLQSKLELHGAKLDCQLRWTDNNFFGGRKRYADANAAFEWSF